MPLKIHLFPNLENKRTVILLHVHFLWWRFISAQLLEGFPLLSHMSFSCSFSPPIPFNDSDLCHHGNVYSINTKIMETSPTAICQVPSKVPSCGNDSLNVCGMSEQSQKHEVTVSLWSHTSACQITEAKKNIFKDCWTPLVVQWPKLWVPNAGGLGSIPGQGTRSHVQKQELACCNKKIRHATT